MMRLAIDPQTGCWNWLGDLNSQGYPRVTLDGETTFVHRMMYRVFVGRLYAGLTIDHLCTNPRCVNPAHLEQVPQSVNNLRASTSPTTINAMKDECVHGHAFTPTNTYVTKNGYRQCRRCKADRERDRKQRLRASSSAQQA